MKHPRNSPCICGSGNKWKKCCGITREPAVKLLRNSSYTYNLSEARRKQGYYRISKPRRRSSATLTLMGLMPLVIHNYRRCHNRHF